MGGNIYLDSSGNALETEKIVFFWVQIIEKIHVLWSLVFPDKNTFLGSTGQLSNYWLNSELLVKFNWGHPLIWPAHCPVTFTKPSWLARDHSFSPFTGWLIVEFPKTARLPLQVFSFLLAVDRNYNKVLETTVDLGWFRFCVRKL